MGRRTQGVGKDGEVQEEMERAFGRGERDFICHDLTEISLIKGEGIVKVGSTFLE